MKKFFAAVGTLCVAVCLAVSAFAAEYGEPNITTQTTMKELRENPSIKGSGFYTYCNEWIEGDTSYDDTPISGYVSYAAAEDAAEGMNLVIENYNKGVQITWQVYTQEQIAETPALGMVQLFYFPAETENAKYVMVVPGNGGNTTAELNEGASIANQLHELGYAVFVLRYRIWMDMGDNAPLEDLARAVEYITAHAEELGVQPEDYALVGFSSGGQVAGVFANSKRGYGRYHVAKPGVLLLGYSVSDTSVMKPVYYTLYDIGTCGRRYYWTSLDKAVEEGYPPVYFWRGNDDSMLGPAWMPGQYNDFEKALQACNVPYKRVTYQHAPHAIGTGNGTDAEGWMTDAVAFWEAHTTG